MYFTGMQIALEMIVSNVEYQPDYDNLNSNIANTFVDKFVKEVIVHELLLRIVGLLNHKTFLEISLLLLSILRILRMQVI